MLAWLVALVLWSFAFLGALAPASGAGRSDLEESVERLIAQHRFPAANVAVVVLSESGVPVVALNADAPFKPASNQKLLTTAAALFWLGPEHAFETTVVAGSPIREGVIDGDVIVRGSGDPNISGRFYDGDPAALLKLWARRLYEAGLRRIGGDLVADDCYLDAVRYPANWDRDQEERWYAAQVSALSLNDNCVDITVWPAGRIGSRARVEAVPACDLVKVTGAPLTVSEGLTRILVHRERDTNRISVTGRINHRHPPWKGNVTVDDPALFFASVFAEALAAEGIALAGQVRKRSREAASADPRLIAVEDGSPLGSGGARASEPAAEVVLVRHTSTLKQDLPVIHKNSQNLHAELLLRVMGRRAAGEGSRRGGEEAIRRFLLARDIPGGALAVGDGCGLSRENVASAGLITRVLHSVKGESYFALYRDSLAIAGEDGTLKNRFKRASHLHGKVFGKTGFISGVSCLSGYLVKGEPASQEPRRGETVWCFAVLVNGMPPGARSVRELQERICEQVYAAMP